MASSNTMYGSRSPGTSLPQQHMQPLRGGTLTLDIANTIDIRAADPDHFSPGYANVLTWYLHAGLLDDRETASLLRLARRNPKDAAATRKRIAALRDAIRAIVRALRTDSSPNHADIMLLDEERLEAERHGRHIVSGDRLVWAFDESKDLERIIWPVAREAVHFLTKGNMVRVRECAADDCEWLFLDTSKNGSRQFCNASSCGSATRVRRFRERKKHPEAK